MWPIFKHGFRRLLIHGAGRWERIQTVWALAAQAAKQNEFDDRIYIPDPENEQTTSVDVTRRCDGPSSVIKSFNNLIE